MKKTSNRTYRVGPLTLVALALLLKLSVLGQSTFSNNNAITIRDNQSATPYPSTITVPTTPGIINRVTVTITGLSHTTPDDIDMLLVGPNGNAVMLMSDAGGLPEISNVNLTFADAAGSSLPDASVISSGTFKPTDFEPAASEIPEVTSAYFTTFAAAFNGANAKGDWKLYVRDDSLVDSGSIGSWTLNVFTAPVINVGALTNQSGGEDTTIQVPFTVFDADNSVSQLTFTATPASGQTIITNALANVSFNQPAGGTNSVILSIVPGQNKNGGPITMTVNVGDGISTTTRTFDLTVTNINDAPTFTLGSSSITLTPGTISTNIFITLTDNDNAGVVVNGQNTETLTATSSSTGVIPGTNVYFNVRSATGASPMAREFTVAAGTNTGSTTITINVDDGQGGTSSQTFNVTVSAPPSPVFGNPTLITINDNAAGDPYPSSATVGGVSGKIGRLSVSLLDVNIADPDDLNLLLVGPDGSKVILMSDAGGTGGANSFLNTRLFFNQTASAQILDAGPIAYPSGTTPGSSPLSSLTGRNGGNVAFNSSTNQPSAYNAAPAFPAPAPSGPYTSTLDTFSGKDANGTWTLYAMDDTASAGGSIKGGWIMTVQTAPTISGLVNQTTAEDTAINVDFTVGDQDGTVPTVTTSGATTFFNVSTVASNSPTARRITITPIQDQFGTAALTVTATDNSGFTVAQTINVTVTAVNDAPVFTTAFPKQATSAGTPTGLIDVGVNDVDNVVAGLVVTTSSSNTKLLPAQNIILTGTPPNNKIQLFPEGTQTGSAIVTVNVSDGTLTTSTNFEFNVFPAASPQFVNFDSITINNNAKASPYPSAITVSNVTGKITRTTVKLFNVTEPRPDDLDILLVDPNGNKVMILSGAGGITTPVNGGVFSFEDAASGPVPDNGPLANGAYTPTDLTTDTLPTPAPARPYANTFGGVALNTGLNGTNPNGVWSLYVADAVLAAGDPNDRGGIISGWAIAVETSPVISGVPDSFKVDENKFDSFRFTIGDEQNVASNWVVTATSTSASLIPNDSAHLTIDLTSGSTRTLKITPSANTFGTNTVTILVNDNRGNTASKTFTVQVPFSNVSPTITDIPDSTKAITVSAGLDVGPLAFTIGDVETAAGSLAVTATSSEQSIVSDAEIVLGGSGASRTISILPRGVATGRTTITVTVTDANGGKTSTSFTVTINAAASFANTSAITIVDNAVANPYPSTLSVSGVLGLISKVTVKLNGVTHPFPDDVDIYLVGPDGKSSILMSDAGGGNPISNVRLTFADGAASTLPDSTQITAGTYKPTDYAPAETFPAPGSAGPYGTSLAIFNGTNPNGTWQLFVMDDTFPDAGTISGGWTLVFETSPVISGARDISTQEDVAGTLTFTVADSDTAVASLTTTATSTNAALVSSLSIAGTGASRTLTVNLVTNISGTDKIVLSVTDGSTINTTTINLTVTPVNDAPTVSSSATAIANIGAATTTEDTAKDVTFFVQDVDTDVANVVVTATSSNTDLVPNATANLTLTGTNVLSTPGTPAPANLKITPALNATGTSDITITAADRSDGSVRNSKTFTLTVTPVNDPPTISLSTNTVRTIVGRATATVTITVGDIETSAENLVVTAAAANTTLVPNSAIALTTGRDTRTITIDPGLSINTGTTTVTINVSDSTATTSTTLTVTIDAAPGFAFGNSANIVIADNAKAGTYPSVLTVAGVVGSLGKMTLTLDNLSHTSPDDLDILLVKDSTGEKVLLMSDTGGTNAVSALRLTFDDTGRFLPDEATIQDGVVRPTNFADNSDTFAAPAPAAPYAGSLSAFTGIDPNGTWSLYIMDDATGASGTLGNGWSLNIIPRPTIGGLAATATTTEDTATVVPITIGDANTTDLDALTVTLSPASNSLYVSRTGGTGANRTLTLTPTLDQYGTNTITVTVNNPNTGLSTVSNFVFAVTAVNDVPAISRLSDTTTAENRAKVFDVQILDPDATNITLTATSSKTAIVSNTTGFSLAGQRTNEITIRGASNQVSVAITPSTLPSASADFTIITITANDGVNSTSATFRLDITPVDDPPSIALSTNAVTTTSGNTTAAVTATVTDPDSGTLTVTATSDNTTLVPAGAISISGSGGSGSTRTITVTPTAPQTGTANIAVTVSDGTSTATKTIVVTVLASRDRIFSNRDLIRINDNGAGNPYPSTVDVSGLVGNISKTVLSLNGFTHAFPDDVDILLVSPDGRKVLVMSDAGGGQSANILNNAQLIFDDTGATAIPDGGQAVSGTRYKPSNYEGASDNFVSPAPAGPYATTLSEFNGSSGNGTWSLYVMDDTTSDFGAISNGWTLTLQTAVTITGLANQTTLEDVPSVQSFTLVDEPGGTYNVVATSSDQSIVTNSNISISGTSTDTRRTVTVTPNRDANTASGGPVTITLTVTPVGGQVATSSFTLTVTPVNDAPIFTPAQIGDQTTVAGSAKTVTFDVNDAEVPRKSLVLAAQSSNQTLLPDANISITGDDTGFTILLAPVGAQSGRATVTLTASDGALTTTNVFSLTVSASETPLFANSAAITIRDNNTADPYPSTITVANVAGDISRVIVTLAGVTHKFPDDIDVLLVGPGGRKVVLMSDAGGGNSLTNARIKFDGTAASEVPDNSPIGSGTFRPRDWESTGTEFPTQSGPFFAELGTAFNATNPNGVWSLYVVDDASPDAGSISGGWLLNILTTAPLINGLSDVTVTEDTGGSASFTLVDSDTPLANLVLGATASDTNLVSNITFSGTGASRTATITPRADQTGTTTINFTVSDGPTTTTNTINFTVTPVNDAPTFAGLANVVIQEDTSITIPFTVSDVDNDPANIVVTATAGDVGMITSAVVSGSGNSRTVTLTPGADKNGSTVVTFVATDGTDSTTLAITVTVAAVNDPPTITAIDPQTINEDGNVTVTFTVSDVDTGLEALGVAGSSTNPTLLPVSGISVSGSGAVRTATVTPAANQTGVSTVTISVTDGTSTVISSFVLTVNAVNDAPAITAIGDVTVDEDNPTSVAFAINDVDTALANLFVVVASSNTSLIPTANIVIGAAIGTGNRFAIITPATNQFGTSIITVTVSDGSATANSSFTVTVNPVNDAPFISFVPDQNINEDQLASIPVTISDPESADLTITASSSAQNVLPNANLVLGGSGTSRTVSVRGATNASGLSIVTISATDGSLTTVQSFVVNIAPVNDAPTISGIAASVTTDEDIPLTLNFTVTDLDSDVNSVTLSSDLPAIIASVKFGGSGAARNAIITPVTNANGSASISFVASDGAARSTNTFSVTVRAVDDAPTMGAIGAAQITNEDQLFVVTFGVNDQDTALSNLVVRASSSNQTLVPDKNIVITGTGVNRTLTATPVADQNGSTVINVSVTDGTTSVSQSFTLTVASVADLPVITGLIDDTIAANDRLTELFQLAWADGNVSSVVLTGTSSNPTLVPNANIVFNGTGDNRFVVVTPVANQGGTVTITLNATAGGVTGTGKFVLTVTAPPTPVIAGLIDATIPANDSLTEIFQVTLTGGSSSSVTLSGASSNTDLVPNANIVFNGTGDNRFAVVTPRTNQSGQATITVTATAGGISSTASFVLTVEPVPGGAPARLSAARSGNGQVKVTVTGTPGRNYSIEASTDLVTWTQIGTVIPTGTGTSGTADFTDTGANLAKRFYRANSL